MKKSDLQVGVVIHNGKSGRFYAERKIIGAGPEFVLYPGQEDKDCLQYIEVNRGGKPVTGAEPRNITRTALAAWGKGIVRREES